MKNSQQLDFTLFTFRNVLLIIAAFRKKQTNKKASSSENGGLGRKVKNEELKDRKGRKGGEKELMWSEDAASVCVYVKKNEKEKGSGVPLQQSVGSAFTVAEQSGRHSRPAGSTWHAISSAPGTQASAIKTTPNKHTPSTLTTCEERGWGLGYTHTVEQWCLPLEPDRALLYLQTEVNYCKKTH